MATTTPMMFEVVAMTAISEAEEVVMVGNEVAVEVTGVMIAGETDVIAGAVPAKAKPNTVPTKPARSGTVYRPLKSGRTKDVGIVPIRTLRLNPLQPD